MQRNYAFDDWGLPARRSVIRADKTVISDYSYHFNVEKNNLERRTNEIRRMSEDFGYDELNRLCAYGNNTVLYDNYGNIRWKGDAGQLVYTDPNRPYAVTGLTPVEDNIVKPGLDITYTAGERPSVITQDTKKAVLVYNANHDRIRMQLSVNDLTQLTRYYLGGNYELDIDSTGIQERLYLGGGYYDAPAVLVKQSDGSSVYFIHRDYLGSILQITDVQGSVVEENSFDAWGCRRNSLTHEVYADGSAPELMLGRGFTGHEHLPMFGLINMNARLYDPVLGRFLSPDPYVQILDYTQAFNRYSYCMNSPLCYVDENGEFWWLIAAAVIGGAINVATHWDSIDNFGQGLAYFGVGAAAGAIGAVTGGAATAVTGLGGFVGGAIGGFVGGATSGFTLGFGNTLVGGGNIGDAWSNGLYGALYGSATGTVAGGLIGGGLSFVKGQNVWTGQEIAQGRGAFSLKNTPINTVEHPEALNFSIDDGLSVLSKDPLLNNMNNTQMTPYDKGQLGVNEAMREFRAEGGTVYQTEVSVDVPDGTGGMIRNRFDFVGELNGKLHLFEVKNGSTAGFTPNQQINLPKLMSKTSFIFRGGNALKSPFLKPWVNKPYTSQKGFVVVYKHYF
ncbi:RHS repeat domain-containing protein [Bacteroides sp. AN502(2024)]|uniref:RHS repeat domain-containing protein n=1 Tax=Bacteroides sp. AN502(2024) TaxID=3160599 RepID=UPI0035147381